MTFAGLLAHRGSSYARGLQHGEQFRDAVRANITTFLTAAADAGLARSTLFEVAQRAAEPMSADRRGELVGIAAGAGVDVVPLLAYNLLREAVVGDGCTVLAAVGRAARGGATVLMKNSDQTGDASLHGDGFHRHKEINVAVDITTDSGRRIVGVSAAGTTGLKMGVNDAGVVAASNIARTQELAARTADIVHQRGGDRSQILRDSLEHDSSAAAARWVCATMIEYPTDTPGNVEIADARQCFVVEGSYEHWTVQQISDDIVCRTNRFVLLDELNDPADDSSRIRYERGRELLSSKLGDLEPDDFVTFSQDHANGPGLSSICRHSDDYRDETSLSAMVVALHPTDRGATEIRIALGKPCHAWPDPNGVLTMRMSDSPDAITERFRSGEAWKQRYSEAIGVEGARSLS